MSGQIFFKMLEKDVRFDKGAESLGLTLGQPHIRTPQHALQWEEYEKKDYIKKKNEHHVIIQYRTRFGYYIQRFAGNYLQDKSFTRLNWLCQCFESHNVRKV